MKHVFLTGEIQIGKSTVIQKTLSLLGINYGGFCTYFGPDRFQPERSLYIGDAAMPRRYGDENAVAYFREGVPPRPVPERFDTLGAKYLSDARETARLIIMDECGNFERDALKFQNEIFRTLEGDTPVLGVLKLTASGWADRIREDPKVQLVTVDKENRDALPAVLFKIFQSQ